MKKKKIIFIVISFLVCMCVLLLIVKVVLGSCSTKNHDININGMTYKFIMPVPKYTVEYAYSGSIYISYITVLSKNEINSFFENKANECIEKGFLLTKNIEDYKIFLNKQENIIYYIPDSNIEFYKKKFLFKFYRIEYPFFDKLEFDDLEF